MSFSGAAMTIAVALKLADQMSGPLQGAVNNAKAALDGLSKAGADLAKIKLFESTKAELEQLGKQFDEAKRQRDFFAESAGKGGDSGAKLFGADVAAAKQEVLHLARAVEEKKKALNDAGQALRDAGVDMDKLGDRTKALSATVEREAKFEALSSRLKDIGQSARQAGERLESIGRNAAASGAAIGAGVGKTVASFASQEQAMARMQSAMTTDQGLSKNFERVQALVIDLGNRLPGNTADFAEMTTALLELGVTEESILGGVGKAAANLAVVMRLPYTEAAEIAAKLKEATGTSEADMLRFMDVIQRTGAQGVKSGEMMLAFSRSAGALKQYNIQGLEESQKLAAVYAQLIKSGASGETVGTGFFSVLNRLREFDAGSTKNARNAAESLTSIGVSLDFFDDKTGEFKGIDNLIAQLDKLKNLDPQRMGDVLGEIAGGGQDSGFLALLAKGGVEGNQAMKSRMAGGADINTKVDIQLATLAAKWESATGTFDNLLARIGETMAPKLGEIVDWFNKISEAGIKLVSENKELFGWLGLGAAAVAGTLVAGGALALGLGTVAKLFGGITEGFAVLSKQGPLLGDVTDTLGKWGSKLATTLGNVGKAAMLVVRAHPILAAIFGAAALGFMVYDNREAIGKGAKKAADLGKGAFAAIGDAFDGVVEKFKSIGGDIMDGLWSGIQAAMRKPLEAIGDLAKKLPQWAKDLLGIKSPSRVFMAIGHDIGAGLVVGIADSEDAVRDAAKGLADVAVYAADEATRAMILEQERAIAEISGAQKPGQPVEVVAVEKSGMRRDRLGRNMASEDVSALDALQQKYGAVAAAAKRYQDSTGNYADNIRNVWERAFKGMEDALTNFVMTGKLDFKSLANSIIADMVRISIQESVTKGLVSSFSGLFSSFFSPEAKASGGYISGPGSGTSDSIPAMLSNGEYVIRAAAVSALGTGFLDRLNRAPAVPAFALGGSVGPIQSGQSGKSAAPVLNVVINNNQADKVQATVSQQTGPRGTTMQIQIDQIEAGIADNLRRGRGAMAGVLGGQYGLNRAAGAV